MKATQILLAILSSFALLSCSGIPLPGGGTASAVYHPPGLSCGYPEGFIFKRDTPPVVADDK